MQRHTGQRLTAVIHDARAFRPVRLRTAALLAGVLLLATGCVAQGPYYDSPGYATAPGYGGGYASSPYYDYSSGTGVLVYGGGGGYRDGYREGYRGNDRGGYRGGGRPEAGRPGGDHRGGQAGRPPVHVRPPAYTPPRASNPPHDGRRDGSTRGVGDYRPRRAYEPPHQAEGGR